MQICLILTTRSWALQDKETHLSKNRSVVIRLESQYRSRTINMRGELEVPPLLRQHCWPSTPAVSVSPAADTNANSERQEEGKREKDKVCISVRDMGRQGAGGGQVQSAPRGVATRLKAWKRLLKIYTPARHFNVSNIQTICLKKNKLLPRSKGTEAPWSRPSMFLFTAVFQCRLKKDFITITFLIKAWIRFLHNHSSLPSSEWRWHNILDSLFCGLTDRESVTAM